MKLTQMTLIVAFTGLALPSLLIDIDDYRNESREMRAALEHEMQARARSLSVSMQLPVWQLDDELARKLLDALFQDEQIVSANVYETAEAAGGTQALFSREMPERATQNLPAGREPVLSSVQSDIVYNEVPIGVVRLGYHTNELEEHLRRQRNGALLSGAAQVLTSWALLGLLLYLRLVVPVRRLQRQAQQLSAQQLDTAVRWRGFDEIGEVGIHLDEARESIRTSIQRQHDAAERIRFLAYCNPMTSLPNRVALEEHVTARLAALPDGARLAFLDMDMDRFKHVNESYGHTVGDLLLVEIAARLAAARDPGTWLAHMGGDEFVVVRDCNDESQAIASCTELLALFRKPFMVHGIEFTLTPSIGIAIHPQDGANFLALQQNADAAMYSAKSRGGNAFARYNPDEHARTQEFLLLENRLRYAIERAELELYYQPQFALATRELVGFEALLRWKQPEIGPVSPAKFIPVAEASGLIVPIGDWVLAQVAQRIRAWRDEGLPAVAVAVNISSVQIRQGHVVPSIRDVLHTSGIDARLLKLEITESSVMEDDTTTNSCMDQLAALGVRLSIDDFGTGYSNLKHLRRFRFDQLKLDQSFVRGLPGNVDDAGLVRAMIGMAGSMGLRTIAEGVETEEQFAFLAAEGCDEVQGYLLGRPGTAAQAREILLAARARVGA